MKESMLTGEFKGIKSDCVKVEDLEGMKGKTMSLFVLPSVNTAISAQVTISKLKRMGRGMYKSYSLGKFRDLSDNKVYELLGIACEKRAINALIDGGDSLSNLKSVETTLKNVEATMKKICPYLDGLCTKKLWYEFQTIYDSIDNIRKAVNEAKSTLLNKANE